MKAWISTTYFQASFELLAVLLFKALCILKAVFYGYYSISFCILQLCYCSFKYGGKTHYLYNRNSQTHCHNLTLFITTSVVCVIQTVGFTNRHLHQRVEEHKRSTIGYHIKDEHGRNPDSIGSNFEILKKCQSKLDCLIFEMLSIRKLKPKLNKQSDSICAKLFV